MESARPEQKITMMLRLRIQKLRCWLALALCTPMAAMAAQGSTEVIDPVAFQKRFQAADTNQDGKLTREEAYAAFPRMPEYFDEIDANADGAITLKEVRMAMVKRVNAAMNASKVGSKYLMPPPAASTPVATEKEKRYFSSRQAAARYHRTEYYETIAEHSPAVGASDGPVHMLEAPAQFQKKF